MIGRRSAVPPSLPAGQIGQAARCREQPSRHHDVDARPQRDGEARGQQLRYLPQKVNRPDGAEMLGNTRTGANETKAHIQNFLDCVRTGAEPNCPFEVGFRTSIACRMTVDSYRLGRTLRWDPVKEEIV